MFSPKIRLNSTDCMDDQLLFAYLRNQMEYWAKTSSLWAINHLSHLEFSMRTWNDDLYELTFVVTRTDDLKLEEWRYTRSPRRSSRAQDPALLQEVKARLQDTIQVLMRRKAAKTLPNLSGLCMFQLIIANESNWMKLLDKSTLNDYFEAIYGTAD